MPAGQPAVSDKPSHTSSVEERNLAHTETKKDEPKLLSASEAAFQRELGLKSPESTENRDQSEHYRDGLPPTDGQKPPDNSGSCAGSLWSQAYAKLDKNLVDEYEDLLRKELPTRSARRMRVKCYHSLFS